MRTVIAFFLTVAGLVCDAAAQTAPPPAAATSPDKPAATQPARPLPGRFQLELLARRLTADLQLDDAQRASVNELAAKHRADSGPADREKQLRTVMAELQAAREQNDRERVAALARQVRELRDGDGSVVEKFLTDVEPLLRDDQKPALARFREQWSTDRRRGASGANRLERTVTRLADELQLSDEQRTQFDELAEQYRARFAQQAERRAAQDEERATILRELRDARDSGKADSVRDLEQQLAARRDQDFTLLNEFLGELDAFLTDDQRAVVEQYRDRNAVPGGDVSDVRTVLRAARRVRLEPEQRERLREIERDTIAAFRKLPDGDAEARTQLAAKARESILALLSDAQKAEFEEHLSRGTRSARPADAPAAAPVDKPEAP